MDGMLPEINQELDDELFSEAKFRFYNYHLNRVNPRWRKIVDSLKTDEGRGFSNIELAVTLDICLTELGVEFEYVDKASSMPRNNLYNSGVYIPNYNFSSCRDKVVYIFPEARFSFKNCRVDFAIYYRDGYKKKKWIWEVQTRDHLEGDVYENDCEKMQHLYLLGWHPMWFTSRQVFKDKEGKFLKPFLEEFPIRYNDDIHFEDNRVSIS